MRECGEHEQVPGWYVVEEKPCTNCCYGIGRKQHHIGEGVEVFTLFQTRLYVLEGI